jgi:exoribonuclease R
VHAGGQRLLGRLHHGAKHPSLYRVHEGPTPEKRTTLQNYLRKALGWDSRWVKSRKPAVPGHRAGHPRSTGCDPQIHTMLLRSMQQAIYTPSNSGHFGSGLRGLHPLHQPHSPLPGSCWFTA